MIAQNIDDKVLDIQSKLLNREKESTSTSIVINGLLHYALKQNPTLNQLADSIDYVKRSET